MQLFFIVNSQKAKDKNADLFLYSDIDKLPYEESISYEGFKFQKYNLNKEILSEKDSSAYLFVYVEPEYSAKWAVAIRVIIKKIKELNHNYLFLPENKYLFFYS